jgi:heat shock protein HslJ
MSFAKHNPNRRWRWVRWGIVLGIVLGFFVYGAYPHVHPLNESTWALSAAPDFEVQGLPQLSLNFSARRLHGNSFVNSYNARVRYRWARHLVVDQITSTLIASSDPRLQAAEASFFDWLQGTFVFQQQNNQLKLCRQKICWVFIRLN